MGKISIKNISRLVDVHGITLEENLKELSSIVEFTNHPKIFSGYVAADTQTFDAVSRYIKDQISPQQKKSIITNIPNHERGLIAYFINNLEDIQSRVDGNTLVIKARGFEKLEALDPKHEITYRIAHDYDQGISDYSFARIILNKKIVVVTQIDPASGEHLYNLALDSAIHSQHRTFCYIFKKPKVQLKNVVEKNWYSWIFSKISNRK